MKGFISQLSFFAANKTTRRNSRYLAFFLALFVVVVSVYATLFHVLMEIEGQKHSWLTGFYWTLTVMSTLGFGDITFQSDIGRFFSIFVLLSGTVLMLIVLPFTFIEFFYSPFLKAQSQARAPRELSEKTAGHVILTEYNAVTQALIAKLERYSIPYYLICPDMVRALELFDEGVKVVYGELDDTETYMRMRVDKALLVVAANSDPLNTNIAFTIREINDQIPIATFANSHDAIDCLYLAGSSLVVQLGDILGRALARRVLSGSVPVCVIGQKDTLLIAEATCHDTELVGVSLRDSGIRQKTGVSVVGVWERGKFILPGPHTVIHKETIILLTAKQQQIENFERTYYTPSTDNSGSVIVVGGGRVGRAVADELRKKNISFKIIEEMPARIRNEQDYILGSAADHFILEKAGLHTASTFVITTHNDDINIYLTIYCRKLRPDAQIISRATLTRNINTLYRAGADFVMSYASMGAESVFSLLHRGENEMIAEGIVMYRTTVPATIAGKKLIESNIRTATQCSVMAIYTPEGNIIGNPDPEFTIPQGAELLLIGSGESEDILLRQGFLY